MKVSTWKLALGITLAAAVCSTPVYAKGNGNDKHETHDRDDDHDRGRDHARDGHGHDKQAKSTPPGWSKGKKTGWGDCDVPPGQAKKVGCPPNSRSSHDRDHDRHHHVVH